MEKAKRNPQQPVLTFKPGDTKIEVFVINPGESFCYDGKHYFQAGKTASLIYRTVGPGGLHAVEHNLWDAGTWAWIQQWMEAGMTLHKAILDLEKTTEGKGLLDLDVVQLRSLFDAAKLIER